MMANPCKGCQTPGCAGYDIFKCPVYSRYNEEQKKADAFILAVIENTSGSDMALWTLLSLIKDNKKKSAEVSA